MLTHAKKLADIGFNVRVVAANLREKKRLEKELRDARIHVETPETISATGKFDWKKLAFYHNDYGQECRECAVLVDHFAIESHLAAILKELHAYDEASSPSE